MHSLYFIMSTNEVATHSLFPPVQLQLACFNFVYLNPSVYNIYSSTKTSNSSYHTLQAVEAFCIHLESVFLFHHA